MKINKVISLLYFSILGLALIGCDGGLEPIEIEPEPFGAIIGTVTYTGDWPPEDELLELVFVPLNFIPQTFLEVLVELDNIKVSDRLEFFVDEDSFIIEEIENGTYIYNIIANQFGPNLLLDWRPLGVYTENDGVITVNGDTTFIQIDVDFDNLPSFPPD